MNDAHALDARDGISDDIAYLRAAYPKGDWANHVNFGELCNFWLHVHQSLRTEGAAVERIIAENPAQVEKARENPKLTGWFVGQVMKATGGKANPKAVNQIVAAKLAQ